MNIQQNLNALLAMGAVGVRATETYDKNARVREIQKNIKEQKQFGENALVEVRKNPELKTKTNAELIGGAAKNLVENQKELSRLKPGAININKTLKANMMLDEAESAAMGQQESYVSQITSQRDSLQERYDMLQEKMNRVEDVVAKYKEKREVK